MQFVNLLLDLLTNFHWLVNCLFFFLSFAKVEAVSANSFGSLR